MIPKETLEKIKEALQTKKANLEKELSQFATKDAKLKGDWDSKFPRIPEGSIDDEAADEVEEYSTNLPIEFSLETQLQNVNDALERMKKDTYGVCEKCRKQISEQRLLALPEAPLCAECAQ